MNPENQNPSAAMPLPPATTGKQQLQPAVSSLPAEALAKAGPAETPAESRNRSLLLWLIGGLIIMVLGVAVASYLAPQILYSIRINKAVQDCLSRGGSPTGESFLPHCVLPSPSPTPSPSAVQPQVQSPSPAPDPTANWKIYISPSDIYSIKFPPSIIAQKYSFVGEEANNEDYKQQEKNYEVIGFFQQGTDPYNKPHMVIGIYKNPVKSLEKMARKNYDSNIKNKYSPIEKVNDLQTSSFNGIRSYEFSIESVGFDADLAGAYSGYHGVYRAIWTEITGKIVFIIMTDTTEFDQILSAFKFLD